MKRFFGLKNILILAAFLIFVFPFSTELMAFGDPFEEDTRDMEPSASCSLNRVNDYLINEKCDQFGNLTRRETYLASTNDIVKFEKYRTVYGITYPVRVIYYERANGKRYRVQEEIYKIENEESRLTSVRWNEIETGKTDYYYPSGKLWKTKLYNPKTNALQWIIEYQESGLFRSVRIYTNGTLLRGIFFDESGDISRVFDNRSRTTSPGTPSIARVSQKDTGLAFFNAINAEKERMNNDVGFVAFGDSITASWKSDNERAELWNSSFGNFKPLLAGIGLDQTQNVLWRINNGNIDGIAPKVIMLMIGTNNLHFGDKAEETALGTSVIIAKLKAQLPGSNVLLMGIAPRLDFKDERVLSTNTITSLLARDPQVTFLDLRPQFTDSSGKINHDLYDFNAETNSRDQVHLSTEGYRVWANSVSAIIQSLYKNN